MPHKRAPYDHVRGTLYITSGASSPTHYDWQARAQNKLGMRSYRERKDQARRMIAICRKAALKRLLELHPDKEQRIRDHFDAFKASVTKEQGVPYACGGVNGVYLPSWSWTDWTIAHEVAHFADICEMHLLNEHRTGHSPHWVGWFIHLLSSVFSYSSDDIQSSLRERHLRYYMK